MEKTIIGIFTDRTDVEDAITTLQAEGFNPKDISIVMRDMYEQAATPEKTGARVTEGTVSGATTGTVVGGIAGLLAGTVLPGLGGFLIGGPIGAALGLTGAAATTISGAATGAVVGGLLGGIMNLGLNEEEARHYESRINEGAILVAVPVFRGEERIVMDIFDDYFAQDINVITHEREVRRSRSAQSYGYAMGAKGGSSAHPKKPEEEK